MLFRNGSGWRMLAVLEKHAWDGSTVEDNSLQYLAIVFFKACLSVSGLVFCCQSLRRSLMGVCGLSLCLADTLLLGATAGSWALRGRVSTAVSQCFIIAHASTIYSLLPIPFLLLGALDYAVNLACNTGPFTPCRALSICTPVLFVWALAGLYSYHYTDTQVREEQTALVCTVQSSSGITYFLIGLSLAVFCVLLFYCQREPNQFKEFLVSPKQWVSAPSPESWRKLPFSPAEPKRQLEAQLEGQPAVPLLLCLTSEFASIWAPFLVLSVTSEFLRMPIPSYLTVNIIWLLCANSFLIGATLWFKRHEVGPCGDFPDDLNNWSLYWYHGNRGVAWIPQEKLPRDYIYTLSSSSTTEKLLHI